MGPVLYGLWHLYGMGVEVWVCGMVDVCSCVMDGWLWGNMGCMVVPIAQIVCGSGMLGMCCSVGSCGYLVGGIDPIG
ncbi:hypothetical protein G9A89_000535 [Geosiphon pyriformis]|nr:hypothetical protein G9A89_000535 [Geosiphon pyriformis]